MEELFEKHEIMQYVGFLILLTIVFTVGEIIYDFFWKKNRDWKDTGSNILMGIGKEIISKSIIGTLGVIILYVISLYIPWEIPMNIYSWILAFILADFTYYWMHRIEHEHSILWAFHSVHHSSESYNLTTALRLSWFEDIIEWIFLVPMVLLGFHPFQVLISIVLVVLYQHFLHTEKINKLGFLEKIFNTPSHHRVHHGSNRKYLDKNYSGVFIIWDKIFGTFQQEEEKVVYGLTKNIGTYNPLLINTIEFYDIYKRVKKCRNIKDKIKMVFGKTGWKPNYFLNKSIGEEQKNNKKQQKNYL